MNLGLARQSRLGTPRFRLGRANQRPRPPKARSSVYNTPVPCTMQAREGDCDQNADFKSQFGVM